MGDTLPRVVVGVVTDGPSERQLISQDLVVQEINELMAGEFDVIFPDDKALDGGWSLTGIRQALATLLSDPEVDVILTVGLIAGNEAAQIEALKKPVIAPFVADVEVQAFPYREADGASGKSNFVYVSRFSDARHEVATFQKMAGFEHLGLLADRLWIETLPGLDAAVNQVEEKLGIKITILPVTNSVEDALAEVPAEVDAVYLTPLLRLGLDDVKHLANGLILRRLPSFSEFDYRDVEVGILMGMASLPEDNIQLARRIALNLQSILLGENAGDLRVGLDEDAKMTINMRTARAIGFSPNWQDLLHANKLFDLTPDEGRELELTQTLHLAVEANLDLQAIEVSIPISEEEIKLARAGLLPQIGMALTNEEIDPDLAEILFLQAENTTDFSLLGSQLIYSDQVWANFQIARYLKNSTDYEVATAVLDTLNVAGTAFLAVLRAKAVEQVFAANVDVTRVNLDLAYVRERVGYSSRADVLRWESQLAIDQQDYLDARAFRQRTEVELNRILNLPQNVPILSTETDVGDFLAVMEDPRFQHFLDNPRAWLTFQEFIVEEALENAPELFRFDQLINAQKRRRTAAQRSYYVPDVFVDSQFNQNIDRSGTGSSAANMALDDQNWSVRVQATLPLFAGGARYAEFSQSRFQIHQLDLQRGSINQQVEARARNTLFQIGSSYPSIQLARAAADAASANLELVTDQYAKGAASVTDLTDAQNNALTAELAYAQARYDFLIDYINVLRSAADFSVLLEPNGIERWYDRIDVYFQQSTGGSAQLARPF